MQLVVIKVEEGAHPQAVPDEAEIEEKEREKRIATLSNAEQELPEKEEENCGSTEKCDSGSLPGVLLARRVPRLKSGMRPSRLSWPHHRLP